jgi:hypothetical protein
MPADFAAHVHDRPGRIGDLPHEDGQSGLLDPEPTPELDVPAVQRFDGRDRCGPR